MTDSNSHPPADSTTDIEVARILDAYLAQVDAGEAPSREEFFFQHPDHAARLRECLDGLDLLSNERTETKLPAMFGDFQIRGELGRGGMGVVYEAYQTSLDRIVALKVMRFGSVDSKNLERFQREAETAAGLHHTNIVPVFATGCEGDTSWYAMQLIDGESLAQRIDNAYRSANPTLVPIEEVIDVGIQAGEALDYAHKRGVVHRDVKPANLIVDKQDVVWLTDFGLARRLVDLGTTATGALLGTPRYMSPEQTDAASKEVTHHSDIYSLAATLYELTIGVPPFDSDDPLEIVSQIRNDDPQAMRDHRRDVPRDLDIVLSKGMAKNPTRRYATAGAFVDDLRAVSEGRPIRARELSWIERSVRWARRHESLVRPIGIAIVTTIAAVLLVFSLLASSRERSKGKFRIRAAGGPFAATIRRDHADEPPIHVTVPMQDAQSARKGNYSMQLAPRGRWSKTVRFHVAGGDSGDFRFHYQDGAKRELPIAECQAVPTADFDASAMLIFSGNMVRRLAVDSENDWEAKLDSISADRVLLPPPTLNDDLSNTQRDASIIRSAEDDVSESIDFRYLKDRYAPWSERTLDGAPRSATPVRALQTAIDLDGDGRSDTIIASPKNSALLALDADGQRIWCKHYVFPHEAAPSPDAWSKQLVLPGILDLHNAGDQNNDGVDDLLAQVIRIQPAVQNDVCIVVISGRTGELIRAIHRPAITVANGTDWPRAGMLFVNDQRYRRSRLIFSSRLVQNVFRPVSNQQATVVYKAKLLNTNFALPLPLKSCTANGKTFAVQSVGDEVNVFDLSSGNPLGQPTNDALCYDVPRIARSKNGDPLIVLLARKKQSNVDFVRVQSLNGQRRWELPLDGIDRSDNSNLKYSPSWPLVEDLNSDGVDEVIAPVDFDLFEGMGVQAYELSNGTPLWRSDVRQFTFIADGWVERIVVTADVNDDGWRDIATVTIAGKARPIKLGGESGDSGQAYVYVDWLSGATGQPLMWARHPISVDSNRVEVCEIDAVRSDLHHANDGLVEIELITGESKQEHHLECVTIRFSPSDRQAISVANGLTVCDGLTTIPEKRSRWYRQRPGMFGLEDERLVLLDEPNTTAQRLGENRVIAAWNGEDPHLAVESDRPNRVSVVRAKDLSTVWSAAAYPKDARFRSFKVADDRVDFIAPLKEAGSSVRIMRLDGLTGKPVWTRPTRMHGDPVHAQYIHNSTSDALLVVDNGRYVKASDREAFNMSLVNAQTGELIWNRSFLEQAAYGHPPDSLSDFAIVDVNGDGIHDICGPDQAGANETDANISMTMWDGSSGKKLWTRAWHHSGFLCNYRPMPWTLLKIGKTDAIAFIEPTSRDGSNRMTPASIVVCNASDGRVTARIDTQYRMHPWTRYSPRIANVTEDTSSPQLAVWLRDEELVPHLISYDVSESQIREAKRIETDCERLSPCWLMDVTGDGKPEGLAVVANTLACYSLTNGELWSSSLIEPQKGRGRFFSWEQLGHSNFHGAIWSKDDSKRTSIQWIDLRSGKILNQVRHDTWISTDDSSASYPPVVLFSAEGDTQKEHQGNLTFVTSAGDGIRLTNQRHSQSDESSPDVADPRQIKRLPLFLIPGGDSLLGILWEQSKRLLAFSALILVPLVFLYRVFHHRRWSLRSLMLSPAILMFFLVAWKNVASTNSFGELLGLLFNGFLLLVAICGIFLTLRRIQYGAIVVVCITALSVLSFILLLNQDKHSPFRYFMEPQDYVLLTLVMLVVTGHVMLMFFWARNVYRNIRRLVFTK